MIDTKTVDLGGLKWCPDGSKIAVWDGIHSGQLSIYSISGSQVGFDSVFGVHNIEWSPSAQIIAVATVGSKVFCFFHPLDKIQIFFYSKFLIFRSNLLTTCRGSPYLL